MFDSLLCRSFASASAVALLSFPAVAGPTPFATTVVDYVAGSGVAPGFDDPTRALGSPTRINGQSIGFPTSVTPFNQPFAGDEVVSIGEGGSLTLAFDHAVTDDALNPFGLDLLIFGNAFAIADDFNSPNPRVTGFFSEGGVIELSADGVNFVEVPGAMADGPFPTLGFSDETLAFGGAAGSVLSDFTRPVDPAVDLVGMTIDEIVDAYNGSGGGVGIDIASVGLASVTHVRFTNPFGSGVTPDIDAISDVAAVPAPGAVALAALALVGVGRGRGRRA